MSNQIFASNSKLGNTPVTVIAFTYSGDYRVDVLLSGANSKWQPDLPAGQTRVVSYSFAQSVGYLTGTNYVDERKGLTPFTEAEKAATRSVLNYISSVVPITFKEVVETSADNSPVGDIRLVNNDQADSSGYALFPSDSDTLLRGDVFLANSAIDKSYAAGSFEYDTTLHEIAHALGLKHPGNYNAGTEPSTDPGNYLATSEDSKTLSVVSYAEHSQELQRIDFAPYDLLALKYMYGLKPQNLGNSTYIWTDAIGQQLQTLIDDGGQDQIDLQNITTATRIDLREGSSSSAGLTGANAAQVNVAALQNIQMAFDTVIETVLGSPQADTIIGNASPNKLEGRGGSDVLDGGDGIDTAVWTSPLANYKLSQTATGFAVQAKSGIDGTDQLQNIERLLFSDTSVALDLNGNAGTVAKILGAVFGREAINNKQFVGIGLSYSDAGWTYDNLAGLALTAAGASTPDKVVTLLWTNVIGFAPTEANKAPYIAMLQNGMSYGALAHLAADTVFNTTNINLTGLAQTGLEYAPIG
jgi:serralysin